MISQFFLEMRVQELIASEEAELTTRLWQQKLIPALNIVDGIPLCSCLFSL